MSELFQKLSQEETLRWIDERLNHSAAPPAIIKEMSPRSRDEAVSWGRRLTGWEEHLHAFPAQAVALARVISRRAMQQYRLVLREDGRVVGRPGEGRPWKTPRPDVTFRLAIDGGEVQVEYTKQYFPNSGTALLYFRSPHEPARPHPLSETCHLSRFVSPDAVEACGGPHAYAALLADALLQGREKDLTEAFEGTPPEAQRLHRRPENPPITKPGGHAERVIAQEAKTKEPPEQRMLFYRSIVRLGSRWSTRPYYSTINQ